MKKVMSKLHKCILWYAGLFSPVMVFYLYWTRNQQEFPKAGFLWFINQLGLLWILCVAYIPLALLFYRNFRESLLSRLAGFRERDEREQLVTAHASRATFLLMLALQIILLVFSMTTVDLVRDPNGHGTLSIGVGIDSSQHLNPFFLKPTPLSPSPSGHLEIHHFLIPPNLALILLMLILVQVGAFKLFSRRRYEGTAN
ncbi:MAG: hypothetical protein HY399_00395 [Elusimicrobia bacterium]|nr:hypothetical protein [Elusimicrobiota bacterium]